MNVEELMKELEKFPGKKEVYVSSDEEGNSFHVAMDVCSLKDKEDTLVIWPGGAELDPEFEEE